MKILNLINVLRLFIHDICFVFQNEYLSTNHPSTFYKNAERKIIFEVSLFVSWNCFLFRSWIIKWLTATVMSPPTISVGLKSEMYKCSSSLFPWIWMLFGFFFVTKYHCCSDFIILLQILFGNDARKLLKKKQWKIFRWFWNETLKWWLAWGEKIKKKEWLFFNRKWK